MKDFWEARYSEEGFAYGTRPNAWLEQKADLFRPGARVLAVADGEGRNGVWLAGQGLDVLSVDQSAAGLAKARRLAAERGVAIHTETADLFEWDWPQRAFDAVVSIYVHFPPEQRARMHRAMLAALKPGGVLLLEAFRPEQLEYASGGPRALDMLYTANMLREDLAGSEIIELDELLTELDEGPYHAGAAAILRLVAVKPSD